MAKRKRNISEEKRLKSGKGQGVGKDYKPWITIQDVPSKGRSTRLRGYKSGRQHEFLSDMETNYFYILEFSDGIVDIREQYPLLPLEETLLIAESLGIRHPLNPKTKEPIVMTTDFLITVQSGGKSVDVARTVKPSDQLVDKRILEKFEIERHYWTGRGIDWGIVTEKEIDRNVTDNIKKIREYWNLRELDGFKSFDEELVADYVHSYIERLAVSDESVRVVSGRFDRELGLASGSGLSFLYYLIVNKLIRIDMTVPIDLDSVLQFELIDDEVVVKGFAG